jgi:predicted ATPase
MLRTSLFEWLRYIGLADDFDFDDIPDDDTELFDELYNALDTDKNGEVIIQQGKKRLLKNVGFGVSQVLPIILQCILAEPDSTIIIEQPELHLHPKMQSRLADFFLAMSLLGKQIIIETHSEYIIDKLRLRIVQAPLKTPINDKIAIYFAEKKDGNSEFRRIHINEYSVVSEWPEGFFEESMQIAREILFSARQKEKESGASEDDND